MTDKKPRGLAALKLSDPVKFAEIIKKGGASSPNNFKNMSSERRRELGAIGGSRRRNESQA